jgi:CheY-like chemotaxis protein
VNPDNLRILLADDDSDDCMFFQDVLDELSLCATLNTVSNGAELMHFLESNSIKLPHMLFLDLNMPLKSGFDCLSEIKQHEKLKHLPVIIYSTSLDPDIVDVLYNKGALYYIRKPADFMSLKAVINKAILLCGQDTVLQPSKDKFVIQP